MVPSWSVKSLMGPATHSHGLLGQSSLWSVLRRAAHHSSSCSHPALWLFWSLGDLLGLCPHLPGGRAGGCAWTVLQGIRRKQVNSCYWELPHVSASRRRQLLRLPAPPMLSQPKPKAERLPPQASPHSIHVFSKELPFGIKFTAAEFNSAPAWCCPPATSHERQHILEPLSFQRILPHPPNAFLSSELKA